MKKGIVLTILISLFSIVILILAIVGCHQEPAPQPEVAPDPFTVVWGPGKDYVVTFTGDSAGHAAGEISKFTLKLDNNSSEPWQGEYIIHLIGHDNIVMKIAHDTFKVPAGHEPEIIIPVEFNIELDGPYGLSLYIPERKAQSIHTIWIGERSAVDVNPWPSIGSHPWLWPESMTFTEDAALQKAREFVENSPTFVFDGIEESLKLVETLYPDMENTWQFVFTFKSRLSGYGDRTGENLLQLIMPHEAIITIEQDKIKNAVMDEKWDMINQQLLESMEIALAPIHEVEVNFMESFPIQVGVLIKGGLRDSCTSFHEIVVTREGSTINVEVTTQRKMDAMCAQVYGYFEENLNLGSDFTTGTTYTLNVNDYTKTFTIP